MRLLTMVLLMSVAPSGMAVAQTPPPIDKLPPTNRVADPARPDFGYARPWAGAELTVVVVLSPDCEPCAQSVPFYKRLTELQAFDGKSRRLAFLTQGGVWPVIDMVEKHPGGFRPRNIVSYPSSDWFKNRVVPTIYVLGKGWTKRGEWSGKLTAAQENEVLALIASVAKGTGK